MSEVVELARARADGLVELLGGEPPRPLAVLSPEQAEAQAAEYERIARDYRAAAARAREIRDGAAGSRRGR